MLHEIRCGEVDHGVRVFVGFWALCARVVSALTLANFHRAFGKGNARDSFLAVFRAARSAAAIIAQALLCAQDIVQCHDALDLPARFIAYEEEVRRRIQHRCLCLFQGV